MIRPKNMKSSSAKLVSCAAALALTTSMAIPGAAFAATQVTVEGETYDTESSGEGWSWDGQDDMTLNNYAGGAIYAVGDLVITLVGENVVESHEDYMGAIEVIGVYDDTGELVEEGDLTITGEGSLDVKGNDGYGIYNSDGDVSITGTTVSVEVTGEDYASGISADCGDVSISGSKVSVTTDTTGSDLTGTTYEIGIDAENVSVTGSDLTVTGSGEADYGHGIFAGKYYVEPGADAPSVVIAGSKAAISGFATSLITAVSITSDPDTEDIVTGEEAVGGVIDIDDADVQSKVTDVVDEELAGKTLVASDVDGSATITPSEDDPADGTVDEGEAGDDAEAEAEVEDDAKAEAEEGSASATGSSAIAQTGDGTALAAAGAALAAALAAACAAISRRKVEIRE